MRIETKLQNKAIHEILMGILKGWRLAPAAKQGALDEGTRLSAVTEERLREVQRIGEREMGIPEHQDVCETVILSPGSPGAGSSALPSEKSGMEETRIIPDRSDLKEKRAYPPRVSDIYETVILNPKEWNMKDLPSKEKGNLLDTVLVRCPEESMDRKSIDETMIEGTEKAGRSKSKTFEEVRKPPKSTGGALLDQTLLVGSGNEKEGE